MDLEVQHVADGVDLVKVVGRLDSAGVEAIGRRLSDVMAAHAPRMIVDLSDVSFLASVGIRVLLTGARALRQRGGSMALLKPQPMVERTLEMTGIGSIIPIFHDVEAASAAMKAPPVGA